MATPALELRNVTRVFGSPDGGGRAALNGVSLVVPAGRTIAIVGRSGSGKSTLLHLAAGIDQPTTGTVLVDGRDLRTMSDAERTHLRRDTVGLVFQFFHLLPHLSVRDNVSLPAWIAGVPQSKSGPRVDELLRAVGLADRAGEPVQRLSGGEMQRIAICRALLARPRLLLADEPTGNLDDTGSQMVMQLLLDLVRAEGSALVLVTHSREIAALADETRTLHSGLLEQGPTPGRPLR
jgi:putative ABC transport system ATP-binding protein